jgi:hypothetical protein
MQPKSIKLPTGKPAALHRRSRKPQTRGRIPAQSEANSLRVRKTAVSLAHVSLLGKE